MPLIDTIELYELSKKKRQNDNEHTKSITFNHFINFLYQEYKLDNIKYYFKNYDNLCVDMLNPTKVNFINKDKFYKIDYDTTKITNSNTHSSTFVNLMENIDIKDNKQFLIVTDYYNFFNQFMKKYETYKYKYENIHVIIYTLETDVADNFYNDIKNIITNNC